MNLSRIMVTSVVAGTLLFSGTAAAQAQQDEKCWRKVEGFDVHFSIYQAAFGSKPFCQEAPATGDTALTVDFNDPALRKMPTEVRVIEAPSWSEAQDPEADGTGKPVEQRPPKTYPTGTVEVHHKFNAPGYFVEIISIQDAKGKKHVLRFPFQLGQGVGLEWSVAEIATIAGFALLLVVVVLWIQRRNRGQVTEI